MTTPSPADAAALVTVAVMAALADGRLDDAERREVLAAADRLGVPDADGLLRRAAAGQLRVSDVPKIADPAARQLALEMAEAIVRADGDVSPAEQAFLDELRAELLGAGAPPGPRASATLEGEGAVLEVPALDAFILDQALLCAAVELLPDRLANTAILPLQLRLVYRIGRAHGQSMSLAQAKDLAATLGLGAVAQVLESSVRKVLGGFAGGLLGDLLGGATGVAAGATVTFTATYALGHAADRYYAQGRQLAVADLKALYAQFRGEADGMWPRVEGRVREVASGTSLSRVLASLG
ncbi:MAG: hypothetical protein NW201_06950 [Gemmatimonadales bacterium]|nr:hypothetical protein [Gemmatimonadales bacterium]